MKTGVHLSGETLRDRFPHKTEADIGTPKISGKGTASQESRRRAVDRAAAKDPKDKVHSQRISVLPDASGRPNCGHSMRCLSMGDLPGILTPHMADGDLDLGTPERECGIDGRGAKQVGTVFEVSAVFPAFLDDGSFATVRKNFQKGDCDEALHCRGIGRDRLVRDFGFGRGIGPTGQFFRPIENAGEARG